MSSPSVSVIVPTRNRASLLRRCLHSLLAQDCPEDLYEVIVVDDGSTDDTPGMVAELCSARLRYIRQPPLGMVQARMRGVSESRGSVICFIDDDARAEPSWLAALTRVFETEDVGMVGGRVRPAPADAVVTRIDELGRLRWSGFDVDPAADLTGVEFVIGANMGIRASALDSVGGFDAGFDGTALREETDLCVRVRRKGWRIMFEPRAAVDHVSVRWDRWFDWRPSVQFSLAKNNAYFAAKHFGGLKAAIYWVLIEPALRVAVQTARSLLTLALWPVRWLGAAVGFARGLSVRE